MIEQRVSVICPCYNAERYISRCLQSIRDQTYTNIEIIVVDDASCDGSLAVIRRFASADARFKVMANEKNLGAAESRNRAIAAATGRFIALCDADDFWEVDKLALQVSQFSTGVGVVTCDSIILDSADFVIGEATYPRYVEKNYRSFRRFPAHSSIVIDRSEVSTPLIYQERFTPAEDYALLLKLAKETRFRNVRRKLINYRIHQDNISRKKYAKLGQVGLSIVANCLESLEADVSTERELFLFMTQAVTDLGFERSYDTYLNAKKLLKKFKILHPTVVKSYLPILRYLCCGIEPRADYTNSLKKFVNDEFFNSQ